ncbi:HD domain-containing protein [bacterium]|nr:HD domain-containing protein [bacterium]
MKLTSVEAKKILLDLTEDNKIPDWIKHSLCIGNMAGKIAEALNKKGLNLDVDKAITLGYIHDIGRSVDMYNHIMAGYEYMKKQGYDEEYCNICLTHSYLNNDTKCTAGGNAKIHPYTEFIKNHEYTLYEKIINLCDLMVKTEMSTVEKRLIDLLLRKGVSQYTQYHIQETYKLKKYFDDLLGYNLYDLFPEIKNNL